MRAVRASRALGELATKAGLNWIWCPLKGADISAPPEALSDALCAGKTAIADGGAVAIHCSAGIHRTGMFGYALLRYVGIDRETAIGKLRELRAVTADGVGAERLEWGDRTADALALT